ncbi:ATP-binding protein [Streptomyces sp. TLI_105]|uniref:ATP-binding protein n=1 Tax=Streptomyces sp. TLI_105 TaxID=1881019 RepID=UPI00089B05FC|nr:ATP-binding protein [Streptomyces sp. TLI_105]SED89972.1 Anti-sigma regulatory factor (Ser/Thr protein kinase) [Streptomyces sp. TLI_105]
MGQTAGVADGRPLMADIVSVSGLFEGSEDIAVARELARTFLADAQGVHGLPVSERAMSVVELVVSELVTNARKYAPGPCLLTLEIVGGAVEVTVWDSNPTLPAVLAPDPTRVGQHGLEIVMALGQSFAVHREPVGKRITTAIALTDDPSGAAAGHRL